MPAVMTPMEGSRFSQRFSGDSSKNAASFCSRSISLGWRMRACAGIITFFLVSSRNPRGGGTSRAPRRTTLRVCDSRVVLRIITGVSKRSLSSKAKRVNSSASCASDGSRQGTMASRQNSRVSCSFCELWMPGSSHTTMTRPPFTPI